MEFNKENKLIKSDLKNDTLLLDNCKNLVLNKNNIQLTNNKIIIQDDLKNKTIIENGKIFQFPNLVLIKKSIENKDINDKKYLNRILTMPIYSYINKYNEGEETTNEINKDNDTTMKIKKNLVHIGCDVSNFNGNCVYKKKLHSNVEKLKNTEEYKKLFPEVGEPIDYQELLIYNILAFQVFYNRYKKKISELENKIEKLKNSDFTVI